MQSTSFDSALTLTLTIALLLGSQGKLPSLTKSQQGNAIAIRYANY